LDYLPPLLGHPFAICALKLRIWGPVWRRLPSLYEWRRFICLGKCLKTVLFGAPNMSAARVVQIAAADRLYPFHSPRLPAWLLRPKVLHCSRGECKTRLQRFAAPSRLRLPATRRLHAGSMQSAEAGSSVDAAIASTQSKAAGTGEQAAPPTPAGFRVLTENSAHILFPVDNEVFYNNAQIFNRDLSVMVARLFLEQKRAIDAGKLATRMEKWDAAKAAGKPMTSVRPSEETVRVKSRILDALSASGLRAIRYTKELGAENLSAVVANDFDASAVESIRRNLDFNGLDSSLVQAVHADAALTMMLNRAPDTQFDLVDLDPFGSPAPFLDSALQSVSEGGMLAVTCTDMAVLCGNHSEACFGKYGAMPLRGKHCHEFALRLVLGCLQGHASRYKRYIVPMLSCSIDFYIRIFVKVYTSPEQVKRSASKISQVYQCTGCESYGLNPIGKVVQRSGEWGGVSLSRHRQAPSL
jgi:tRNA(guanine-26,N2-N2) methyltransferase